MLRCMIVGLTAEQEEACRRAIVPVEVVKSANVADACVSMSTVLPLVVVVGEGISDPDRTALTDMTTACGAELVVVEHAPSGKPFASRLLDALRIAERRRLGMK